MLVETNYSAFVILVDSTPLLSRKTVAEIDHLEQNLTLLALKNWRPSTIWVASNSLG